MDDPVLRALETAPLDDEPLTPEEEAEMREAYADIAAGRVMTIDEVRRRLDLMGRYQRHAPEPTEAEYRAAEEIARKLGRIP